MAFVFLPKAYGIKEETVQHIVGFFTVATSLAMFGSPLILVKRVIQERNTNLLPLPMIMAGAVTCSLWLTYGILLDDAFIIAPNAANLILSVVQLVLFCVYPRGGSTPELKAKIDYNKSKLSTTVVKDEDETENSSIILKTEDELSSWDEESELSDTSSQQARKHETTVKTLSKAP